MVFLDVLKNNEGVFLVPFVKKPQGASVARGKLQRFSEESFRSTGGPAVVKIVNDFYTIPWEETEPSELYNTMSPQSRNAFLKKSLQLIIVGQKATGQIQLATEANHRSEPLSLDEPDQIASEILDWFELHFR
ncbi:hypothetical protein Pan153_30490 [Gimesia panareensis]|uniref:Uncharacterized protein n=1 Tax=Gimesia panareensis TaxID=2527978 RepID=A0A518FPW4_9PLAN|nr:hypothetical protein [Gimesia panareensis]QDV18391.1 hypothetical protein Pan153_30490 [Gimesia panareensis]